MEEYDNVYPAFGNIAKEEGFIEEATAFYQIAEIEKVHAERFGKIAMLLENNRYYESPEEEEWMCLNCGHIFHGRLVPNVCPVCHYEKGYFIPADLAPFLEHEFLK